MTVERIHPKAPVMLIFTAIFTCLPSCINLSNIYIAMVYNIQYVLYTSHKKTAVQNELVPSYHKVRELYKRLKCAIAIIKRIKPYITNENLKTIYFTLFESHILYGISVWGGIPQYRMDKIFRLQKKCLRILFGNLEQLMDKFNTCARARPFGDQILSSQFYMREHTKPIFNSNKILTVNNLYRYTSACELMKILKFGYPKILADSFTLSSRNDKNLIILLRLKNSQFHYKASVIWNDLLKPLKIPIVYEIDVSVFKRKLKQYLLDLQEAGHHLIWETLNN